MAVELYLDEEAESSVTSLWAAIDALGIPSLGSAPGAKYRPHVSLAVFAGASLPTLAGALAETLASCSGLPLPLASLGFFVGSDTVAFLGVTPTERLLTAHRRVHAALLGVVQESWPIYEPGSWVPHCTLAMNVKAPERLVAGIEPALPIPAVATEAHIVDITSGWSLFRLP
jgi:2'-5' RNA ligase